MIFRKDYSQLGADESIALYGDELEKQMDRLRDKNGGTLRSLFNSFAGSALPFWLEKTPEGRWTVMNKRLAIHNAVLEKNGIEKVTGDVCYSYTPDIIKAAESRGSHAADKIKLFERFKKETAAIARQTPVEPAQGFMAGVRTWYRHIDNLSAVMKNWRPD